MVKDISIRIHTDNFNELYKRLLLQPISFRVEIKDYGGIVYIQNSEKTNDLIVHIADYASQEIFESAMKRELLRLGMTEIWIERKVLNTLKYNVIGMDWYESIKSDIGFYLEDSVDSNKPLKLSAYTKFRGKDKSKEVKEYARKLEASLLRSLVEESFVIHDNLDDSNNTLPKLGKVTVSGCPLNAEYMTFVNGENKTILTSTDINSDVLLLSNEMIYDSDSDKFKHIQFQLYTLIMMNRWDVNQWVVEKEMYHPLKDSISNLKIDINIIKP